MAKNKETPSERADRFEALAVRNWLALDNAGDSRSELNDARDEIQEDIADEIPDVAEQASELEESDDSSSDEEDKPGD
jgi:Ran GTPase-activating protein (RanGAP) involved in mRNA processing and transport